MGAVICGGRTILLKNFDYKPVPTGWAHFIGQGHSHFALVDHDQKGVNSGMNDAGLALEISRSASPSPESPERKELRTVLNGRILRDQVSVQAALREAGAYVEDHPEMYGGNLIIGNPSRICVMEHLAGRHSTKSTRNGFFARTNHSIFGMTENADEFSKLRYDKMVAFLASLHERMDEMEIDELFGLCRGLLRSHPILHDNTRSSMVMCPGELRVDYLVGDGEWQVFRFDG
jgi:hypothetical protein